MSANFAQNTSPNPYGVSARQSPNLAAPIYVAHRPAAVLPATAQTAAFRVKGGPVRVHQWLMKMTIAASATATNLTPVANPDSGLTDVNLATATAIASIGVGTLVCPTGAGIGSALQKAGAVNGLNAPPIVDIGSLDLLTSATNTGACEQWLVYQPLTQGAYVIPALPSTARGQAAAALGPLRWLRRPAQAIPATTQTAILRVTGGPIILWGLWGKVTTAASATATNLSVVANPTSGLTDVVIGAATAIASTALNSLLSLSVAGIGTAIQIGGSTAMLATPIILDVGTVDLLTSATNPMAATWSALWTPLHTGGRLILA